MKRDGEALTAFINSRQSVPHRWGSNANDCMSFAAGAVKAQTGVDPARGLKWRSHASAIRLLNGLGGVEAILDARFKRVPPSMAKRGDIAGVPDPDLGIHPMIVEGMELVSPGEYGNARAKRSAMVCAWSVVKRV